MIIIEFSIKFNLKLCNRFSNSNAKCLPPLGWTPPEKQNYKSDQKSRIRRESGQIPETCKVLSAQDFPRTCRIKLVADDLFDEEIGKGQVLNLIK